MCLPVESDEIMNLYLDWQYYLLLYWWIIVLLIFKCDSFLVGALYLCEWIAWISEGCVPPHLPPSLNPLFFFSFTLTSMLSCCIFWAIVLFSYFYSLLSLPSLYIKKKLLNISRQPQQLNTRHNFSFFFCCFFRRKRLKEFVYGS